MCIHLRKTFSFIWTDTHDLNSFIKMSPYCQFPCSCYALRCHWGVANKKKKPMSRTKSDGFGSGNFLKTAKNIANISTFTPRACHKKRITYIYRISKQKNRYRVPEKRLISNTDTNISKSPITTSTCGTSYNWHTLSTGW